MVDEFCHSVMAGEMYAKVVYLKESDERKTVKHQKPKKSTNLFLFTPKKFLLLTFQ